MDPLAPSDVSQSGMINAAFDHLISDGSAQRILLMLGVLLVTVLQLGFFRYWIRMRARYAVHMPLGQQLARSLSKQESPDPPHADIRARAIGTLGEGLVTAEIE